ncbi:phosphatase PAP2 family protein [Paenibacillus antibioticophila]|uniref:phosphatase PAP2 family protein n=1 Tax=Paenibacillus antibioticophila TaxID=1274374 RepID=UPI0006780B1E|nr:phosphatase PAP2 family protein [Paenibacillus antibioticophila]
MSLPDKPSLRSTMLSLLWLLIVPVINVFYGILNHPGNHVYSLKIKLDLLVPFIPSFIIPYLLWYPFITFVLITLAFKNRHIYFQTLLALCVGLVTSYIFFALFQTGIERPIPTESNFIHHLVRFVYSHDQPYNCFPSIHVLTSYLMIKGARILKKTIWVMISVMSIFIIVSTVFVKQHVLADVIGGVLVAEISYRLCGITISFVQEKKQRSC